MWCNECFGGEFLSRLGVGEEFHNLPPQSIWLRRIKTSRDCRFPELHLARPPIEDHVQRARD
jgi:hypothetical protein